MPDGHTFDLCHWPGDDEMDHAIEARHREAAEEWRGILVYPPHTPGDAIEDLAADFARFEASLKTTPTELREAIFGAVHPVIVRNTPSVGRSCIVVTDEIVSAILTLLEKPHAEAGVIPAGWALVPVEPTEAMIDASLTVDFTYEDERSSACNFWHVMLAASPKAQPHAEADRVSVPSEPTRQWAVMLAEIRQGQSSTPRCEPPGEADIQAAARMIGMVLRAAEALTQERS